MVVGIDTQRFLLYFLWPVVIGGTVYVLWRRKEQSVGLVAAYLMLFTVSHWLQALVYTLPWYSPLYEQKTIATGFWMATIGLLALAFSVIFVRPFFRQFHQRQTQRRFVRPQPSPTSVPTAALDLNTNNRLPLLYLVMGLFVAVTMSRINVPTISAYISAMGQLFTVGLLIAYWRIIQGQSPLWFTIVIVGLTLVWPIYIIGAEGFLHFGLLTVQVVFVFVIWHRKSKHVYAIILLPVVAYLGLSLLVSYFGSRNQIRAVAWHSSSGVTTRVEQSANILLSAVSLFDIYNSQHLVVIDERLSQNYLIGLTVERFEAHEVVPAYGETLVNAVLMLIPRVIWTDKPVELGGQAIVNKYSGFSLYGNSSVQPGQTMEFYLNFGVTGVIIGFIAYGLALVLIDERAAKHFRKQNWAAFGAWMVGGLALLKLEDSMIAVVGAGVSGLLGVALFNYGLRIIYQVGSVRRRGNASSQCDVIAVTSESSHHSAMSE